MVCNPVLHPSFRRLSSLFLVVTSVFHPGPVATGQTETPAADSVKPPATADSVKPPATADSAKPPVTVDSLNPPAGVEPPKPDLRFNVGWVSTAGSYTYVPEKWGELHINLVNRRETSRELLCVSYFDEQPLIQFGRRVWLPARTKIQLTHPILIPKCDSVADRAMNLHSLIFEDPTSDDQLIKNETGQLLQDGAILVKPETRTTALIGTRTRKEIAPPEIVDLVVAGRAFQGLSSKITYFLDSFLPADETSLNAFEHLVIADNRIVEDVAALSAVRHWLNSGGKLWVMLDHVDPIVLERLLGDDFKGHLVDRVGLTSVRIDEPPLMEGSGNSLGETAEFDDPVLLARLIVEDFRVLNVVNGWPAALTRRCGDGFILVTTLGCRGWMNQQDERSFRRRNSQSNQSHAPVMTIQNVLTDFFGPKGAELVPKTATEQLVREYVGYNVPSWSLIVGSLLGFSVSLIAAGLLLWKAGRLEHFAWVGSTIAVLVSVVLLMIGRSFRHSVTETVASIQLVQAVTGTDDVRTDGLIAAYHPEGSRFGIRTSHGGRLWPDMQGTESSTRRLVTTDFGAWHWDNLNQPAGMRVSPFTKSETVTDRIEANATFDTQGLIGEYSGRLPFGTDAMVGTRNGRIGVTFNPDGSFTGRIADVFDKDQYLNANLLGDEQNRRRRAMRQLFTNPQRRDYPERPQLFFWTDRWDNGFELAENVKPQNSTLMAIPVVFHRPASGAEIVIPSPFLPYQNRNAPDGTPPSSMWNNRRNEWQDRSEPGSTWLGFQIPHELLPLAAVRARVTIEVSGPVGLIELNGAKNGNIVTLKKIVDPVGTVSIDIDDSDVLSIDAHGQLVLGLTAGDPSRPELTHTKSNVPEIPATASEGERKKSTRDLNAKVNYWRIDSLKLQLWAKVDEPPVKE